MVSHRSAGRRRLALWLLAALAAAGCGEEPKIASRASRSPRPCRLIQPAAPEHRPRRRAAELHRELRAHVDLSQADRLHREVDRGHRRQGEEGRRARHPLRARAGRGVRDEEGDRRSSTRSGSSWPRSWWRWPRPTSRRPRARVEEAKAILGKYQAEVERWDSEVKRLAREVERGVVDPQILLESTEPVEGRASPRGTRRRRPSRRRRRNCSSDEAALAKAKVDVAVAQRRPGRGRERGEAARRPGWATSRSPRPTTA